MNIEEELRTAEGQSQLEEALPQNFPAFAPLLSDAFEHLTRLSPKVDVPIGTNLVTQGISGEPVSLIVHGLVKLVHAHPDGRIATLGLRTAGWYAGAIFVLNNTSAVYSTVAVTPCKLVQLPACEFSLCLMRSAKLMRHFTATLCNEMISQSAAQAEVMTGSAEERLAQFMRERTFNHPKWKVLDTLPLLKQVELAQLLSITPEHLSRLLARSGKLDGPMRSTASSREKVVSMPTRSNDSKVSPIA